MRRAASAFQLLLPLLLLSLPLSGAASAAPLGYPWMIPGDTSHEALSHRFPAPPGYTRVPLARGEFGAWLRELPLEPAGTAVRLFDGKEKPRQDVHLAVVAIDVGDRDLQQCADAVMRLRSEFLLARGQTIVFHPDPKKKLHTMLFDPRIPDPNRKRFHRYLTTLFSEAGSASLQAEMAQATAPAQPGDVLIQGGYPGHAILVVDEVVDPGGKRKLMLAQSYMPAQQIHLLKAADGTPWFDEAALDKGGLKTPEWRPFHRKDVRRF
ncbi:MAG: DUF4846 domain-containing protein [Polyangia bacterium]